MTYQLTPEQRTALTKANTETQRLGLPPYSLMLEALAGLAVAVRDGKPPALAMLKAAAVLEHFRNPSATTPPPTKADASAAVKLQVADLLKRLS